MAHAVGLPLASIRRETEASGVMMLPIPRRGILHGVAGLEAARAVPGVDDVVITVPEGREVVPLPEGDAYLGFLFARGETPDRGGGGRSARPTASSPSTSGRRCRPCAERATERLSVRSGGATCPAVGSAQQNQFSVRRGGPAVEKGRATWEWARPAAASASAFTSASVGGRVVTPRRRRVHQRRDPGLERVHARVGVLPSPGETGGVDPLERQLRVADEQRAREARGGGARTAPGRCRSSHPRSSKVSSRSR